MPDTSETRPPKSPIRRRASPARNGNGNSLAHIAQREFFESVKLRFPQFFKHVTVLDVGSQDINGSLKDLFVDSNYIGIDCREGKNVDVVGYVHRATFVDGHFDVVVSGEMLEHDEFWKDSLHRMHLLVRPGGLIALSCASPQRGEHGTVNHPDAGNIYGSTPEYYGGRSAADLRTVWSADLFTNSEAIDADGDTYFVGIKKGKDERDQG